MTRGSLLVEFLKVAPDGLRLLLGDATLEVSKDHYGSGYTVRLGEGDSMFMSSANEAAGRFVTAAGEYAHDWWDDGY